MGIPKPCPLMFSGVYIKLRRLIGCLSLLLPDWTQAIATLWRIARDRLYRGRRQITYQVGTARETWTSGQVDTSPRICFLSAGRPISGFGVAGRRTRFSTGRGSSLSLGLKSRNSLSLPRKGRRHSWPVPITGRRLRALKRHGRRRRSGVAA